ncbi:MAG: recombination mediator RecR [Planctomycetia bacterium]|nr:recombination mediator RecR [Planctomycetia bacterium]
MADLTQSIKELTTLFQKLPGVGKKTAERFAYHVLVAKKDDIFALADAIRDVKTNIRYCSRCFNLAVEDLCEICKNPDRDAATLCVVEQPRDLAALEQTGVFHGQYHVLLGRLSPTDNIGPDDLTLKALEKRVADGSVREIIMGTNPNMEGDATAFYITRLLSDYPIKITRLARGVTSGSALEFVNKDILRDALEGRQGYVSKQSEEPQKEDQIRRNRSS